LLHQKLKLQFVFLPPKYFLAVFIELTLVQLVPFQDSVAAETLGPLPPKAKLLFEVQNQLSYLYLYLKNLQ
jgi:hypothetical protein